MSTTTTTDAPPRGPVEAVLRANDLSDPGLRLGIAAALGESGFGERDRYDAFGWEVDPSDEEYVGLYLRNPYGGGLIDKAAQLAWRHDPEIEEVDADTSDASAFEDKVQNLGRAHDLWAYCARVHKAAGFGEYALLFINFDDVNDLDSLDDPVDYDNGDLDNIRGFRVVPQMAVDEVEHGDFDSDRWGDPEYYTVDWGDDISDETDDEGSASKVHHSRVVEVPSKPPLAEEYSSRPRMERYLNTLYDIEKLVGSAAEMSYRGADKGLHINYDPTKVNPNKLDKEEERDRIQRWLHGLQPTFNTVGAEVNDLGGEIRDPTGALEAELKSLSAATGFSKQFIEGAAAGEIASSETNMRNDFGEIRERQNQYVEPYIVRRALDTLLDAGVLPRPATGEYDVHWPDLFELSESEEADIEQKRAQVAKSIGLMGTAAQEYIKTGEFPDDEPAMPDAVDESDTTVANQFDALTGAGSDPDTVTANATVTMDPDIPERYLEEFGRDAFIPPEAGQAKAQRILDIREEQDGVNGGTDTGWRRAKQIAAGIPIPPDEVRQIDAWFSRHPKSEASDAPDDEPWTDNGWIARMLWGWDPVADWAADLAPDIREFEDGQTSNATRYSEGDPVQTPQGFGIVAEVRTEDFEGKNGTVDASESSPTYVVALKDARVGVEFYTASQLSETQLPETDVDDPVADIADQSANSNGLGDRLLRALNLRSNDWSMPRSWRESSTPARVILLKAWAGMNGQFDCGGGCCKGEMLSSGMSERAANQFCGAMKDEVMGGWEGWRN